MQKEAASPGLIFALDVPDSARALVLAEQVKPYASAVKIGLELFCAEGPDMVKRIHERSGVDIFLDLKLHDISRTVCGALQTLAVLEPFMLTLHASCGQDALTRAVECAKESAEKHGLRVPKLLGVTLLTALSEDDVAAIGFCRPAPEQVLRLAEICASSGMDGIVCSPLEVNSIKEHFPQLEAVTPGIRPSGIAVHGDDQARAATPVFAAEQGADYLVIGRPVSHAEDSSAAAAAIVAELE